MTTAHLEVLAARGVTRLSLGIQDFDPKVQRAIRRIQPFELVQNLVKEIRSTGIKSINFDLIYGLPHQSRTSLQRTLEQVAELAPDRIALFKFAYLPNHLKWQRTLPKEAMPSALDAMKLFVHATRRLTADGYKFIGLDHFVKPEDSLYQAFEQGILKRSFQGMTTTNLPVIGFGPTAISSIPSAYSQNASKVQDWLRAVTHGHFALQKGYRLSTQDRKIRATLNSLYCYGVVDFSGLNRALTSAEKVRYFEQLKSDGLVTVEQGQLTLTEFGKLMVRVVAPLFDESLPLAFWQQQTSFSQQYSAV